MNLTIKMFLYEYLSVDQINQVKEGKLNVKDVLDESVYADYLNLLAWVNREASLVRTTLNQ